MMSRIKEILGREIIDSRGIPTVEVEITLENEIKSIASVPSGASTGTFEAHELRDGDRNRFFYKGVLNAVKFINTEIKETIVGLDVREQKTIDNLLIELDGTKNKSRLGANSILAISLCSARTASKFLKTPLHSYIGGINNSLPTPMMNIVNGGRHANNKLEFQEFMIIPVGAKSFSHAMQIGTEIFHNLKKVLNERNLSTAVGDEGGFAPHLDGTEDALKTIMSAIKNAGYKAGTEVKIALDCASSEFYKDGKYDYTIFEGKEADIRDSKNQAEYLLELTKKYPIISIEDGMDENDWDGWKYLNKIAGKNIQLVGDDLFVTNVKRLRKGIDGSYANSILIKVNQIGTLTETIAAVEMANSAGYTSVISHRSGETEDTTIADLAVALNTGQIKTGSASRSDRMSKYNQLIRIEEELGDKAYYPGFDAFNL